MFDAMRAEINQLRSRPSSYSDIYLVEDLERELNLLLCECFGALTFEDEGGNCVVTDIPLSDGLLKNCE